MSIEKAPEARVEDLFTVSSQVQSYANVESATTLFAVTMKHPMRTSWVSILD